MKQSTKKALERVELLLTRIVEGKRPAVWIVDPTCTPDPAEGWVTSQDDIPVVDDADGQIIILVRPHRMRTIEK